MPCPPFLEKQERRPGKAAEKGLDARQLLHPKHCPLTALLVVELIKSYGAHGSEVAGAFSNS